MQIVSVHGLVHVHACTQLGSPRVSMTLSGDIACLHIEGKGNLLETESVCYTVRLGCGYG